MAQHIQLCLPKRLAMRQFWLLRLIRSDIGSTVSSSSTSQCDTTSGGVIRTVKYF